MKSYNGDVLKWFNTVKNDTVVDVETFVSEHEEIFEKRTKKNSQKKLRRFIQVLNNGLRMVNMENCCRILFENHKESGIKLEIAKEQVIKNLEPEIAKRILETHTWKKLIQEAYLIDLECEKLKEIKRKNIVNQNM